jgi:hypothetical protein
LDKEFLPKESLYSNKSYGDNYRNLLDAVEILEKAQNHHLNAKPKIEEEPSFWSKFLNPFKCGKSD